MTGSSTRTIVLVTGLITAVLHLALNLSGQIFPLLLLNGLGYLVLLAAFYFNPGPVASRRRLFHFVYIGYAFVTILGFLAVGDTGFGGGEPSVIGWITKLDEVILIAALWRNLRYETSAEQTTMI